MTDYSNDTDEQVKPYNLFLAANPVIEAQSIIAQIASQQANIFEHRLTNLIQADVQVTEEVMINQDPLHAQDDKEHYRLWVSTNEKHPKFSVITIDKSLPYQVLNMTCGGTVNETSMHTTSERSPGEKNIVEQLVNNLLQSIYNSIKATQPAELRISSRAEEMEAEQVFKGVRHHLISTAFTVSFSGYSGDIKISSPTSNLRSYPIDDSKNHPELLSKLLGNMMHVELPMRATLGSQPSSLREINSLRPGDIIPIHKPMEADVFIHEKSIGKAKVLTSDNKFFLQFPEEQPEQTAEEKEPVPVKNTPVKTRSRRRAEVRRKRTK